MLSVIWSGAGNASDVFLLIAAVVAVIDASWSPCAVPPRQRSCPSPSASSPSACSLSDPLGMMTGAGHCHSGVSWLKHSARTAPTLPPG